MPRFNNENNLVTTGRIGLVTPRVREAVLRTYNFKCQYCSGLATAVDHILPVQPKPEDLLYIQSHEIYKSMIILDCFDNLTAICQSCNSRKGNNLLPDDVIVPLLNKAKIVKSEIFNYEEGIKEGNGFLDYANPAHAQEALNQLFYKSKLFEHGVYLSNNNFDKKVKHLLKNGADLNLISDIDALYWAAANDHLERIIHDDNVKHTKSIQNNLLNIAIENISLNVSRYLLGFNGKCQHSKSMGLIRSIINSEFELSHAQLAKKFDLLSELLPYTVKSFPLDNKLYKLLLYAWKHEQFELIDGILNVQNASFSAYERSVIRAIVLRDNIDIDYNSLSTEGFKHACWYAIFCDNLKQYEDMLAKQGDHFPFYISAIKHALNTGQSIDLLVEFQPDEILGDNTVLSCALQNYVQARNWNPKYRISVLNTKENLIAILRLSRRINLSTKSLQNKVQSVLKKAVKGGEIQVAVYLLEKTDFIIEKTNRSLFYVAYRYNWGVYNYLLKRALDLEDVNLLYFIKACGRGNLFYIKNRLYTVDLESCGQDAFRFASYNLHYDVMDFLILKGVDPAFMFNDLEEIATSMIDDKQPLQNWLKLRKTGMPEVFCLGHRVNLVQARSSYT